MNDIDRPNKDSYYFIVLKAESNQLGQILSTGIGRISKNYWFLSASFRSEKSSLYTNSLTFSFANSPSMVSLLNSDIAKVTLCLYL